MSEINNSNKTVKWGIIGCGDVTERKSGPAYSKTEGFELFAVMRRDAEKVKDYALRHNVPHYFSNADELINHPEINAVYIATPPDTHKFYALKVAQAGKICCIEKPMAVDYHECEEILKAFDEKKLPLFVAYYRRSLPRFNQIKEWIDTDEIGKIRHISWYLSKTPSPIDLAQTYNWRTDAKIAPGGYFEDLASHGLDLFAHYFGEIKSVNGISLNQQKLYSAKDAIVANWLHESGVTGSGTWNFGSFERKDKVEIIGSKGKIEFAVFDEEPLLLTNQNGTKEIFIEHPENIQLYHVQNVRDHLLGVINHPSLGKYAAQTNWVMDKIVT
ncbi:MAG TPA: Gfo/Idh/MocA family oxidoreductase [Flavobacterium sp.]|uniref:Gfo/Idh/MocA family protein n=1 Tax=unclassified Flavobacterium TaxID=196869 RepID=UPI0025BD88BF|nr:MULTISPECIES: Gfo/Idh/MocA family oxidoreductase [unclassified Flavobacterium]HRE77141.1 Gfo/Idh/MocA family oxidoreductase [Flavobacterium sp.]